jgi:hypothetical protein
MADAGAAYVFKEVPADSGDWQQQAKLSLSANDPPPLPTDRFGRSVGISADFALVGTPNREVGPVTNAGAAYVFHRDQGGADAWGQVAQLLADAPGAGDTFGWSVAIQDQGQQTVAVVGAPLEENGAVAAAGAAYIFTNTGPPGVWTLVTQIQAATPVQNEQFGYSLAIDGDFIIIGAPFPIAGQGVGAVYIFHRSPLGTWSQVARLTDSADPDLGEHFGLSVALADLDGDDFAFVGEPDEDVLIQQGNPIQSAGAVHLLRRSGSDPANWSLLAQLISPTPSTAGFFGSAVSVAGNRAIAGSPGDEGNIADDCTGATFLYLYNCRTGAWSNAPTKFIPLGQQPDEEFGSAVAAAPDGTLHVGAPQRDDPFPGSGASFILGPTCPADVNQDGQVTVVDLTTVVLDWGPCPCTDLPCLGDVNADGATDVQDLVEVILHWGPGCAAQSAPALFDQCVDRCAPTDPGCVIDCAERFGLLD